MENVLSFKDNVREKKIVPLFQTNTDSEELLERHVHTLKQAIDKIFGNELFSQSDLHLPLVKWSEHQKTPSAFWIYFLSYSTRYREMHFFFQEMVSRCLVPNEDLQIISSQNLLFNVKEKGNRSFYFVQFLVHVENDYQLAVIKKNLPGVRDEIKLGALSKGSLQQILEMKRLSPGERASHVYERIFSLMKRYPQKLEYDLTAEIQQFLVHCRDDFRALRDTYHLCRIICSLYLFKKALQKEIKTHPDKRHFYFKLLKTHLHYPAGLKKTLGLAIAFNSIREYECFEERHILKACQRLIPDIRVIPDSFYSEKNAESKLLCVYLEFEKIDGTDFTLQELIVLKKQLGNELKNSIEYLTPSLFIPRNEEELYRNIITLSQELKYVHDLPQAIISFQEQRFDILKFNVICLRLLHADTCSLQSKSHDLSPEDRFIQERVSHVGFLRKRYIKEANVFSLEIKNNQFLRKNHSVDLIRARQYVVKAITTLVGGPFRDYNGGFLLKQNEQLQYIKNELGEAEKSNEFLLENLFYSISPSIMQTIIPPISGKKLCQLFLQSIDIPFSVKEGYNLKILQDKDSLYVVIKLKKAEIKDKLHDVFKLNKVESLQLAYADTEVEGYIYLCYLYLNPTEAQKTSFIHLIKSTLQSWTQKELNLQRLNLHLPRATQSLDPRIGGDRTSGIVLKMLFEGLMRIGQSGKPEFALAEHIEISDDYKKFAFTLKETFWSNGMPVTAYDFEYAWTKVLEPNFRSPYCFLFFIIKNAKAAKEGRLPTSEIGVKALDHKILQIETEYPAPYFPALTAHWTYAPLCKEIDQRHPGWAYHNADTHISNGPFKLNVWKMTDDLELVKNPFYWNGTAVKLDKIDIKILEDQTRAFNMFKNGELDWVGDPISKLHYNEIDNPDQIITAPVKGVFWLQVNIKHLPFSTPLLRKAFAHAINRKELIKIWGRDDKPIHSVYLEDDLEPYPYIEDGNIEKARLFFQQGLQELGLVASEFPLVEITHGEDHAQLVKAIGKMWEEALGVQVNYKKMLWNNFFAALTNQDYMAGALSWYSRSDDPLYYLDLLTDWASVSITQWKHEEYTQLIIKAKQESDLAQKHRFIEQASMILKEECPVIPILLDAWRYMKNPRLKNVIISQTGQMDFRDSYIENS